MKAYSVESQTIELAGGTASYSDGGEGPVLLFVHAGMWSFVFGDVIERLRRDFRCIAIDFPGFGHTPIVSSDPSIASLTDDLSEFIDRMGLRDFVLVLHDLGGPVGFGAAVKAPERVTGFVLTQTFAWYPDTIGLRVMLRLMSSGIVTAIDAATNVVPRLTATRFGIGLHQNAVSKAAFLGPFQAPQRRRRFHLLMRSLLEERDHLERMTREVERCLLGHPVLTIFGERNDPFGFQLRLHRLFEDHHGVIIQGGNHFPMMDDPARFARSVREWMQSRSKSADMTRA